MTFKVPAAVRTEARQALEWRRTLKRGGTSVGVATARALSRGRVSLAKVRHVARYFPRHAIDAKAKGYRAGEPRYPSAGRITWGLWGGDAGRTWSEEIVRENDFMRGLKEDK